MYRLSASLAAGSESDIIFDSYVETMESIQEDILTIYEEYVLSNQTPDVLETYLFEEKKSVSEPNPEAKKSFAARVGSKILKLIQTLKKFISDFLDKFRKTDNEFNRVKAEIEKILTEHPEIKNEKITANQAYYLTTKDIKGLMDLQKECEALVQEKNPKTIRGKIEKLKYKWDNFDNKTSKTMIKVAAVTSVVMLFKTVCEAYSKHAEVSKIHTQKSNEQVVILQQLYQKEFKTINVDKYNDRELHAIAAAISTQNITKIGNAVTKSEQSLLRECIHILKNIRHIRDEKYRADWKAGIKRNTGKGQGRREERVIKSGKAILDEYRAMNKSDKK